MSPATGDYLLFLHSMRHRRGQPIYGAIDLTPWAEHQPDDWFGFLAAGDAEPMHVKVVRPEFEIVHVSGHGWMIDGERPPEMEPDERRRAKVETRTTVGFSPPRVVPLPAFVSRRRPTAPRRHAAVVRLADESVAAFADAFLHQEAMQKAGLHNDPGLRSILGEDFYRSAEEQHARYWAELRAETVPAGTHVPAEVVSGDAAVGCVLRLDRRADDVAVAGGPAFHCTLFLAAEARLESGGVLRRRSGLWPPDREPRLLERVVGTIVSAGPPQPLASVLPDVPPDAAVSDSAERLTLKCLACGASHPPEQFSSEAMEVAELTALWHGAWKELALLRRTASLYRRHPQARRYVKPAASVVLESDDPAIIDQLFNNVPISEIKPPRPSDYEERVAGWLADDPELRDFLESSSFDLDARTRGVKESEQKYRLKLAGRSVHCPACGDGLLALTGGRAFPS